MDLAHEPSHYYDALTTFDSIIKKSPDHMMALTWAAHVSLAIGGVMAQRAHGYASRAASQPSADCDAVTVLAMVLDTMHHGSRDALATVDRAIAMATTTPLASPLISNGLWRAYNVRGLILTGQGRLDDAIVAFETSAKLVNERDIRGYGVLDATINRGINQFQRGLVEDALRTFEDVGHAYNALRSLLVALMYIMTTHYRHVVSHPTMPMRWPTVVYAWVRLVVPVKPPRTYLPLSKHVSVIPRSVTTMRSCY
jgi:tetratricopeptide (TPR) repeat protein